MRRAIGWALALGVLVWPRPADAEQGVSKPGEARALLQGCLRSPSRQLVEQLAEAVGAKPYSEVRRRRELKTSTVNHPEPATGQDQRTTTTVTEFRGWDLSGPGAGTLEYQEDGAEIVWVDRSTGQTVTPVRTSLSRSCRFSAPVVNARTIFETYEGLSEYPYGIRISSDRRWVNVFTFDPDRFDIELSFTLDAPIAGLAPDPAGDDGRVILSDGGQRFFSGVSPGIPTVQLTRAALLAGLDRPATMTFFNMEIEPVVRRLAATRGGHGTGAE